MTGRRKVEVTTIPDPWENLEEPPGKRRVRKWAGRGLTALLPANVGDRLKDVDGPARGGAGVHRRPKTVKSPLLVATQAWGSTPNPAHFSWGIP